MDLIEETLPPLGIHAPWDSCAKGIVRQLNHFFKHGETVEADALLMDVLTEL